MTLHIAMNCGSIILVHYSVRLPYSVCLVGDAVTNAVYSRSSQPVLIVYAQLGPICLHKILEPISTITTTETLGTMASHPNNVEIEIKGGYTLSMVILPFLDGADNWLDFSDGIETFLIMNISLNGWKATRPDQVEAAAEKEWKRRHKYAIYTIRARSNYNAQQMIGDLDSYQGAYEILERNYKPQGDGTFRDLSHRFFMISLTDYKNVEDYTKAIKKLSNQLDKLGVTIPVSRVHFQIWT
jgi:hypothetical protein